MRLKFLLPFLVAFLMPLWGSMGSTEMPQDTLLVDEETEEMLLSWVTPLFKVSGVKSKPKIHLIYNKDLNAAASTGGKLFIFTGFLCNAKSAEQAIGVLAHEVGHLAGHHALQRDIAISAAQNSALTGMFLGALAGLVTMNPAPFILGTIGVDISGRSLLQYSRSQESAADQAAATYLRKLKWNKGISGLLDFLGVIKNEYKGLNPYLLTHPMPEERMEALRHHVSLCSSESASALPQNFEETFQRVQAKLKAYIDPPEKTLKAVEHSETLPHLYAKAVAYKKQGNLEKASQVMEILLKKHPNDPYFHELQGEIFLGTGKDLDKAIVHFRQCVKSKPRSEPFVMLLSHALLEKDTSSSLQEAEKLLRRLSLGSPRWPMVWYFYAVALGKNGKEMEADLALTEEALVKGDFKRARVLATRIQKSPGKLKKRAEKILKALQEEEK